jgi:hypothetical protein
MKKFGAAEGGAKALSKTLVEVQGTASVVRDIPVPGTM